MKKLISFLIIGVVMVQGLVVNAQTQVPHRFHFQSVFYDAGGNPLPSGYYLARFALLDQSYERVYSEEQEVELVNGILSTMVGDGFEEGSNSSVPTGGVLRSFISPSQTYYLQAEIEGDTRIMEIGSVPYAHFSEEALSVSAGAVDGESIAERSILREHLSEVLEEAIFGDIPAERIPASVASSGDLQAHINDVSGAHAASSISASGPFANSNASNVEEALKDLDRSVELAGHNLDNLQSTLETQISTVNADLQSRINERLSVNGGSLNGTLNMQGNRIVNLGEPSGGSDAATLSYVDRRIDGLRTDLTAPSAGIQPQVVAMGIVFMPNPYAANLEWGYNIAGVEGVAYSARINFQNTVSTPYIVQLTRAVLNSGEGGGVNGDPILFSMGSGSFLVGTNTSNAARFHFVVYK